MYTQGFADYFLNILYLTNMSKNVTSLKTSNSNRIHCYSNETSGQTPLPIVHPFHALLAKKK
jgi:hypothetical protein